MRRVVSLYLPSWPTDRLRRKLGHAAPPPEVPLVLIGRAGPRRVVTAADAAARAAGLHAGMAATQAHALVPGLVTAAADAREDAAALGRLALWAYRRYAPVVAVDAPDGLMIDASGAAHLHGGETALIEDLVGRLGRAGITARAALAATYGAAHALARHRAGPVLVVAEAATGDALAELPIAALRLPAGLVAALTRLGLARIGELAAQPRVPLALRFGPEPGRRLDQAHGRLPEPLVPVVPPELPQVRQGFAEPIGTPEAFAQVLARLVPALCAHLEARGLGARRLDLLLHRVDRRIEALRVGLVRPVRAPQQLTRLLCDRLATIDPGLGIELMVLTAVSTEPLRYRPAATALGEVPRPDIADLIDLLAGRIGAARLYRYAAIASDLPECSVRKVAPLAEPGGQGWPSHGPRPVRLLPVPEPIETLALLPDHPPAWFTWRGIRRRVRRADGPERVFGEWWRNDAELASVRDYFQVETETGARFWLFREGDGVDAATGTQRWFLHGVFG